MIAELLLTAALQVATARPADSLAWDYADADIAEGGVVLFRVCLDSQPCVDTTLAAAKAGQGSYKWKLPALTVGTHTVTVAACNNDECSDASPVFKFTLAVKPKAIPSIRIGGAL